MFEVLTAERIRQFENKARRQNDPTEN